ncbi:helix-turn-helix domain-containing protein [Spongiimicrobium sp. 2-473A-2-J]|uniref:helix-turn-helix domain-containing protein n=1 Tax=Eudoraea algarum TaxID=3417568 RepID=UPI003D369B62
MIGVNIVGISILGIFLLFIFLKRKKVTSDYLLILTILLFGLVLLTNIWIHEGGLTVLKLIFTYLFNTFLFPSFLIYGLVLIDEEHKIRKKWWWIFSFAIVFNLFMLIDVVFVSDYSTPEKVQALLQSPPLIHTLIYKALYLFIIVVSVWFLKKIKWYQNKIKNQYSSVELIHLNWFRNFTYVYLILHIIELILFSLVDLGIQKNLPIIITISSITMVLAVFYLCYNGIRQYTLAEFHESLEPKELDNYESGDNTQFNVSSPHLKYRTSSLSKEELRLLFIQINQLLDEEKVYLDPQLKIQNLSDRLQISTHKISQTINTQGGMSFFDYVNGFRVEYLKNLLANPENRKYTILALGIESGFNSKASLNRIFKKYVRVSPKEFQKAQFTN